MTDASADQRTASYGRRQFLGLLGAGAVAGAGVATPASAQETTVVEMGNNYFDPIGLHVEPGTTVEFAIAAGSHSATAYGDRIPAEASAFDTGTISGGSVAVTFEAAGTYDYYCIPHESVGMVGRIVVGSPGGPAEEGSIPSGAVPDSDAIVEAGAVSYDSFADDDGSTGMMGPGMMDGGGTSGAPGMAQVGGSIAMLGVLGAALYWLLGDRSRGGRTGSRASTGGDPALATLRRRYERGELDEVEFQRRRSQLEADDR